MMRAICELVGVLVVFFLFYKGITWAIENVRLSKTGSTPPPDEKK